MASHSCQPLTLPIVTMATVLLLAAGAALGCTPLDDAPRTPIEKTYHSPITLYGRVLDKVPDSRFNYGPSTEVYTVEMEVLCVIKADSQIPDRISILEGGSVPGLCHSTSFDIGQKYIVFAREDDGDYKFADSQYPGDDHHLTEVAKVCGLTPVLPVPSDGGAIMGDCPQPASAMDCIHDRHDEHGHDHEHSDSMDMDHEHHDDDGHDHEMDHEMDHEGHDHDNDHDHDHDGTADHEGHENQAAEAEGDNGGAGSCGVHVLHVALLLLAVFCLGH